MVKRMLVDATHPEETRVVVVSGNKLEEFDFETAHKKQLKGNIYLAKVTRVEPSLQAAFVEYGGNRHGFLAFSEIHPDYYRIPMADREALLAEASASRHDDDEFNTDGGAGHGENGADDPLHDPRDDNDEASNDAAAASEGEEGEAAPPRVETVGGDDVEEAQEIAPPTRPRRTYKIQEVIKRRQIMLVQVTKEERGNKGAALTTFLSLAGRYCVLMPNTPRGGGISRKISNPKDRKKMKAILDDLFIPEGMAVILRTAGMERTKVEIKRDLDYLLRLWDSIRELTLQSTAPTLIHEEANLIKRAERDLYNKDIEEILVAGEEGYRSAKDFMRMLMPSHAKKVQLYRDPTIPLFHRYQVESQIDAMHSPVVTLRSGGYIVINPTEALVSIDVNSGRSTRERNIEETAFKTNLEAAEEIARQLRLRDLAGLIVIDFIDMEDDRHNAAVERKLKECMRQDRARIQIGRISAFGLLELSRQRLRPSLTETHFQVCKICSGTGLVRSLSSAALHVLRAIEEEGIRQRAAEIKVHVPTDIALYILNDKRAALAEIEQRYGFSVLLGRDDTLIAPDHRIEQLRARGEPAAEIRGPVVDSAKVLATMGDVTEEDEEAAEAAPAGERERPRAAEESEGERRRRRSRRGRRRRGDTGEEQHLLEDSFAAEAEESREAVVASAVEAEDEEQEAGEHEPGEHVEARGHGDESEQARRKRRRGKRGGRRRSGARRPEDEALTGTAAEHEAAEAEAEAEVHADEAEAEAAAEAAPLAVEAELAPEPAPAPAEAPVEAEAAFVEPVAVEAEVEAQVEVEAAPAEKPKRKRAPRKRKTAEAVEAPAAEAEPTPLAEQAPLAATDATEEAAPQPEPVAAPAPEPEPAFAAEPVANAASAPEAGVEAAALNGAGTPLPVNEDRPAARPYESVNQPPEKPRRGWWRRLTSN